MSRKRSLLAFGLGVALASAVGVAAQVQVGSEVLHLTRLWDGTTAVAVTVGNALKADIASVAGTAISLGQKAMSASIPVVLPTDQVYDRQPSSNPFTFSADCADPITNCKTSTIPAGAGISVDMQGATSIAWIFTTVPTTATYKCDGSIDNENWDIVSCADYTTGHSVFRGPTITNPTSLSEYSPNIPSGYRYFRLRQAAHTGSNGVINLNSAPFRAYDVMWPVSSYGFAYVGAPVQVSQRFVATGNSDGSTNCNSGPCMVENFSKNTSPGPTDYGLFVRQVPGDTVATQALSTQCADPCAGAVAVNTSQVGIALAGQSGVIMHMSASTLTGTVKFEQSMDNNDWSAMTVTDSSTAFKFSSFVNPTGAPKDYYLNFKEGARYVRVRISSVGPTGSATFAVVASQMLQANPLSYVSLLEGTQSPGGSVKIGGRDTSTGCNSSSCFHDLILLNTVPVGTEYGIINREIYPGQTSTTSGQTGPLVQGAVTTAAPTYVTAQTDPLSLTTAGALRMDLNSIIGTTAVTGGAGGSLSIGGTTGNRAAIVQNPVLTAVEARSTTPTAATDGQQIRTAADLAGNVAEKPPLAWSCNLANIAATLTQCQAAPSAGYSLYVTSWIASSSTTTAGTYAVEYGTGSNCGTGGTGVFPQPGTASPTHTMPTPTSTAPPVIVNMGPVGFKLPAANALCAIGVATNTLDFVASGYIAP